MHELGIVFHVIKSVNEIARENNVSRVNSVTVAIGEVSTVIPYYFEDCWNWAVKKETVLKDAKIIIETIPAVTYCENCGKEYPTVRYGKTCPHCGSGKTYLLRGNEFTIQQIEVPDDGGGGSEWFIVITPCAPIRSAFIVNIKPERGFI